MSKSNQTINRDNCSRVFPEKSTRNTNGIKYFKTTNGTKVGVKNEIIIKVKNKKALKNLEIKKQLDENTYLIIAKKEIFSYLQELYKNKNIIYAVPNFYKKIYKR